MRLWHWALISCLPTSLLKQQVKDLEKIMVSQPKNIIINYIYEYEKKDLFEYAIYVGHELKHRNIKLPDHFYDCINKYFDKIIAHTENYAPFEEHHNDRYLYQCYSMLQELKDRGLKDFDDKLYDKLTAFMMAFTHHKIMQDIKEEEEKEKEEQQNDNDEMNDDFVN